MLAERAVVVFYDPRSEFQPFFDRALPETGTGYDGLPRVFIRPIVGDFRVRLRLQLRTYGARSGSRSRGAAPGRRGLVGCRSWRPGIDRVGEGGAVGSSEAREGREMGLGR